MEKTKIALIGHKGKMGSLVFEALKNDYQVVGIERGESVDKQSQIVIDFGSAESSVEIAKVCAEKKLPLIIGSTGQNQSQLEIIKNAALSTPILMSGNFSMGINYLKKSLKSLISNETQDIVIFEKHHREKKDTPSGTAKEIKHFIESFSKVSPEIIFERGGKEIGTHVVDIYYENEVISVTHKAFSREAFVQGVKKAVAFMEKSPKCGLYCIEDIKI